MKQIKFLALLLLLAIASCQNNEVRDAGPPEATLLAEKLLASKHFSALGISPSALLVSEAKVDATEAGSKQVFLPYKNNGLKTVLGTIDENGEVTFAILAELKPASSESASARSTVLESDIYLVTKDMEEDRFDGEMSLITSEATELNLVFDNSRMVKGKFGPVGGGTLPVGDKCKDASDIVGCAFYTFGSKDNWDRIQCFWTLPGCMANEARKCIKNGCKS
jgi:hypothetical protein